MAEVSNTNTPKKQGNPMIILYVILAVALSVWGAYESDAVGFGSKAVVAVIMSVTGFVGILLGDGFRKIFHPTYVITSGVGGMVWAKLFWFIGPQLIGYVGGMFCALGISRWLGLMH